MSNKYTDVVHGVYILLFSTFFFAVDWGCCDQVFEWCICFFETEEVSLNDSLRVEGYMYGPNIEADLEHILYGWPFRKSI